jgi:hypothetical protein
MLMGCADRSHVRETASRGNVPAADTVHGFDTLARILADTLYAESLYRAETRARRLEAEGPDTGPRYESQNTCPWKCCVFGQWILRRNVTIRAAADATSDSIGTLASGDTVHGDSGRYVLQPTGLVVMLDSVSQLFEDHVRFEAGDTIELLNERTEGYREVRWRGRQLSANVDDWELPTNRFRILRRPYGGWWARVTHAGSGLQGWASEISADPWYSCY